MRHYTCDSCGEKTPLPEVTVLRLSGPARSAFNRAEVHACKACLPTLGKLFGISLAPYITLDGVQAPPAATLPPLRADSITPATRRPHRARRKAAWAPA